MMTSSRVVTVVALACAGLTLTGCEQKQNETKKPADASAEQAASALPPELFVSEAPSGARSVGEVKADASAGGDVVIHGRIGGRKRPFVDGVAMFLLADVGMKPCDQLHGDDCPTPWDYCCEPRESLHAKTATIQVVGPDGKPLRERIKGAHGLKALVEIVVAGKIAQRDDSGTLVINADKIYVKPTGG